MTDILNHEMKLLGLIMPHGDEFCSYFNELPEHFTKCIDFRDFYRLKPGKRKESKENLEIASGLDYIIHDPYAKKYFYKVLQDYNDMKKLFRYYNDGNLYILKDELRVKEEEPEDIIPARPEKKETEGKDDDVLLF